MCIPACTGQGFVYPSMHWAGVCVSQHALGRAGLGWGCVSQHALGRGVCVRGVSVSSGGGVSREVQGGVCVQGVCMCVSQGCVLGGCVQGRVCPEECLPQCMLGYTPRVNRMTDRCL